ncbi:hypothetical protein K400107F7_26390 [Agathobaculum massiliense]
MALLETLPVFLITAEPDASMKAAYEMGAWISSASQWSPIWCCVG